jgi:hypothetical protein
MDPLIELPEPAKARIKAKVAQAEEDSESVRRAIRHDLLVAERDWGGYFDLHSTELDNARWEACDQFDQERSVSAQRVFLVHGEEYRMALRNPRELEPVLAKLREALIPKFGAHTRAALQSQEAQQIEKAWQDWSESAPASVRPHPCDPPSVSDAGQPIAEKVALPASGSITPLELETTPASTQPTIEETSASSTRAAESIAARRTTSAQERSPRVPDLQTSNDRLCFLDKLTRELATIKLDLKRYHTADELKRKHPEFVLWEQVSDAELKELVAGISFTPRAYAENLTLRKFGITSRETLKKDRRKIRNAKKAA